MSMDALKRKEEFSTLLYLYSKMLSSKTRTRMESFYLLDLSLSEISENENVSRSAVQQSIKEGEKELLDLEKKIGLRKKMERINFTVRKIVEEDDKKKREELFEDMKGVMTDGI